MAATGDFWASPGVEPKRKFRWLLSIGGEQIPAWTIKKVTKPSITITEIKHSFINHTFYYPGRVEYNEIEFTLVDPVNPDAAATIMQIITGMGYVLPTTPEASYDTITKDAATAALNTVIIRQIGGEGGADQMLEEWTLTNGWIKEVNFGDLDYESDDIVEITIKMRYDWAEFNTSIGEHGATYPGVPGRAANAT